MSDKTNHINILALEDNPGDIELIKYELLEAKINFSLKHVFSKTDFLRELDDFNPDIVLVDYTIPGFSGMEALSLLKELVPDLPVIFVTGTIDEESAVECMKAGATDYVLKNSLKRISTAIKAGIEKRKVNLDKRNIENKLFFAVNILENMPDPVFAINTKGKIMYWNKAATETFGYTSEEMINNDMIFFSSDSRREKFLLNISSLSDVTDYSTDEKCIDKNDNTFWMSINAKILSEKGMITGFVCNVSDIEQRKEEEDKLFAYKEKSENIFNSLPDIICVTNKDLNIIDLKIPKNLISSDINGLLIGKNINELPQRYSFINKDFISQISYNINQALKTNYIQYFEYKFILYKNVYCFELRFIKMNDENIMIIIKDITVNNKENLNKSRLIEGSIKYSVEGKIIDVSDSIAQLLEYSSINEIKNNLNIKDIYYISGVSEKIASALIINDSIQNFETKLKTKINNEVNAKINAKIIKDKDKNSVYFSLNIKHYSDSENEEENIKYTQKLESITRMIADTVYECNSLISSIGMNIYISENELPAGHPVIENLNNIKNSINQASELTTKLLNFNQLIKN